MALLHSAAAPTPDLAEELYECPTGTGQDNEAPKDFFKQENGLTFAGTHLIIDVRNAKGLDDLSLIDRMLRTCVEKAKATLLHIHLHHFTPNGGISGVAVLSESHISIHTWPERGYAALDVFMCGDALPHACLAVIQEALGPTCQVQLVEHKRGIVTDAAESA